MDFDLGMSLGTFMWMLKQGVLCPSGWQNTLLLDFYGSLCQICDLETYLWVCFKSDPHMYGEYIVLKEINKLLLWQLPYIIV